MAQESAELDVRAVVVLGCGGGGGSMRLGRELNATAVVTLGRGGGGGVHAVRVGVEAGHELGVGGVFCCDCGMGRARLGLQRLSLGFLFRPSGLQLRPSCL